MLSYRVLSYIGNSCRSPYNEATVYLPRAILFIPHSVPARSRRRLYDCFDFQALLLVRRLMFLFSPCIRWERIVTFSNAQIVSEEIRRVQEIETCVRTRALERFQFNYIINLWIPRFEFSRLILYWNSLSWLISICRKPGRCVNWKICLWTIFIAFVEQYCWCIFFCYKICNCSWK